MLNKAKVDSSVIASYKPARENTWRHRLAALGALLRNPLTLRLMLTAILLGRAAIFADFAPFGIAMFVGIRLLKPELTLPAAAGLTFGASLGSPGAVVNLLGCMGVFASLEHFLIQQRRRTLPLTVLVAALTCFLVKLPLFILQPPSLFDLTGTALEAAIVAVFVYVLVQGGKAFLQQPLQLGGEQVLAAVVVAATMLLGLEGWVIAGIQLKAIAAGYFIMLAAHMGGASWGCLAGVGLGLAQNIAHPALLGQVGLYAGAGLLAGLFRDFKKIGVGATYTLGMLLLTTYGSQPGDLQEIALSGALAFACFFVSGHRWGFLNAHLPKTGAASPSQENDRRYQRRTQQLTAARLQDLEAIFSQLADTFAEKETDEGFLVEKNFHGLMDNIVTDVCEHCPRFDSCWQKNFYKSYHTLLNMLALADTHGQIKENKIPAEFKNTCCRYQELITCANYLVKIYKLNFYWQKKMLESRTLVANQLRGVSSIMHNLTNEMRQEWELQHDLAEEIKEQIAALNLPLPRVEVYRRRDRTDVILTKTSCGPNESLCTDQLIPLVSCLLGRPVVRMHSKCPGRDGKGKCVLCLSTSQPLRVESSVAQICRTGAGVSGDTASIKELADGKLAVLLSDGMGNGPDASRESRATVAVLEQLLRSGFDQKTAVQTINSVLMLRSSQETFATVDMAVIDLYTGIGELTKIGASATFLKRGNTVKCLKSSSLPAGILHKIDIDSQRLALRPGDILVMLTDGYLDSQKNILDKEAWFARILRQSTPNKPAELVKYLVDRANMNTRNQVLDDMTVVAIRIAEGTQAVPLVC